MRGDLADVMRTAHERSANDILDVEFGVMDHAKSAARHVTKTSFFLRENFMDLQKTWFVMARVLFDLPKKKVGHGRDWQ